MPSLLTDQSIHVCPTATPGQPNDLLFSIIKQVLHSTGGDDNSKLASLLNKMQAGRSKVLQSESKSNNATSHTQRNNECIFIDQHADAKCDDLLLNISKLIQGAIGSYLLATSTQRGGPTTSALGLGALAINYLTLPVVKKMLEVGAKMCRNKEPISGRAEGVDAIVELLPYTERERERLKHERALAHINSFTIVSRNETIKGIVVAVLFFGAVVVGMHFLYKYNTHSPSSSIKQQEQYNQFTQPHFPTGRL